MRNAAEPQWKFCPRCGVEGAHETQIDAPLHHSRERAPAKSGLSGFFFGLIAAPVLIISGGMICLTGLGVFLGVPLIAAGALAPLIGTVVGTNALRGTCLWCGGEVSGVGIFGHFSCPVCSRRIVLRNHGMMRAE